jgi:hypothetical protein
MKRFFTICAGLVACSFSFFPAASAKDVGYYLELGDTVTVGQYTLKEGVIRIEKKGTPIDGFQLIIPPGAFDAEQTFTVQYTKVVKSAVPDYVLSPLITVTGPAVPSNGFLIVKIPCRVPDNAQALIFLYDDKEKFTQSLIPGPKNAGYVTGMIRQLKDMVVVATKVDSSMKKRK